MYTAHRSPLLGALLGALLAPALLTPAHAAPTLDPNTTDPKAIMDAVEARDEGDKSKSRLVMRIIDKDGRERTRAVQSRGMRFGEGRKQIMLFESPEDVRGTGMLSVDYDAGERDDDQWLYLPSLHKSTRISSGEKSGSFMGTDMSFSDMTKADPSHYTYKLLKPSELVEVKGQAEKEDCWVIESTPATEKAKEETGYVKSQVWVSKSKLMPVQVMSLVREGKKVKYIQFQDFKQVDGLWVAHTILAFTKKGGGLESKTILQFSEMSFNNSDITPDLFQQSRLEQGI